MTRPGSVSPRASVNKSCELTLTLYGRWSIFVRIPASTASCAPARRRVETLRVDDPPCSRAADASSGRALVDFARLRRSGRACRRCAPSLDLAALAPSLVLPPDPHLPSPSVPPPSPIPLLPFPSVPRSPLAAGRVLRLGVLSALSARTRARESRLRTGARPPRSPPPRNPRSTCRSATRPAPDRRCRPRPRERGPEPRCGRPRGRPRSSAGRSGTSSRGDRPRAALAADQQRVGRLDRVSQDVREHRAHRGGQHLLEVILALRVAGVDDHDAARRQMVPHQLEELARGRGRTGCRAGGRRRPRSRRSGCRRGAGTAWRPRGEPQPRVVHVEVAAADLRQLAVDLDAVDRGARGRGPRRRARSCRRRCRGSRSAPAAASAVYGSTRCPSQTSPVRTRVRAVDRVLRLALVELERARAVRATRGRARTGTRCRSRRSRGRCSARP